MRFPREEKEGTESTGKGNERAGGRFRRRDADTRQCVPPLSVVTKMRRTITGNEGGAGNMLREEAILVASSN